MTHVADFQVWFQDLHPYLANTDPLQLASLGGICWLAVIAMTHAELQ